MAGTQSKFDLYSRTISNSAVSEFDAEPDPVKRFRKYAYTITNAEQAAIDALLDKADAPVDEQELGAPITLHLDPDVVAHFKKAGGDWQRRINDVLREWIKHS